MKAEILTPCGYCYGVENAIKMALKIEKRHHGSNIYVLGMLVHNEFVCDFLKENHINTINVSPSEYAQELKKLNKGDIVIFTAHGHDEKLDLLAAEYGLITYDAICPMVKKNINLIKDALDKSEKVLYIGQEKHPEAIAASSISNDVKVIPNKQLDNYYFDTNTHIFCINQTTLNYDDILKTHEKIKSMYPHVRIANEVCSATRQRQNSVRNLDSSYDTLLVVGSLKSSNTNKLYDIAIKAFPKLQIHRIESFDQLKKINFNENKKVAIIGGTSTPKQILQLICDYLNNNY